MDPLQLVYAVSFFSVIIAFAFAVYLHLWVRKQPARNQKIIEVSELIHAGANTFMRREYLILARFAGIAAVLILLLRHAVILCSFKTKYRNHFGMAFPSPYKTALYPARWASLPLPQPITLLADCSFEQFYKSAGRYQETRLTYSHNMVKGNIFINFFSMKGLMLS